MTKDEFLKSWLSHVRRPNYPQKTINLLHKEFNEMIDFEKKAIIEQLTESNNKVNACHNNYIKQLEYSNKLQLELTSTRFELSEERRLSSLLGRELTELKEKQEHSIVQAYFQGQLDENAVFKGKLPKYADSLDYYKQKHQTNQS